jgi:large subunit ribosomal protein L24
MKTMKAMKTRLKKGDEVIVITGKSKGQRGAIKEVSPRETSVKIKVEGVAMVQKHTRANPQTNTPSSTSKIESFIDVSNVKIVNPATQKGSRIGVKLEKEKGSKQLIKVRCFKTPDGFVEIGA